MREREGRERHTENNERQKEKRETEIERDRQTDRDRERDRERERDRDKQRQTDREKQTDKQTGRAWHVLCFPASLRLGFRSPLNKVQDWLPTQEDAPKTGLELRRGGHYFPL